MTLSEFATSMGLTVPQILARAVEVDPKFLCNNPGSQVLSDEAETRLRNLLQDSTNDRAANPERKVKRPAKRDDEVGLRKKRGLTHKSNRTIAALAHEYGVEIEELRQLALSLGYQATEGDGSLSVSQVSQLLLRLNESAQVSFGDTSSTTIAGVIKNAGKLRDQPQSHKIRQSPNLRRTRLEVLAKKWDSTMEVLSDICSLVRVEIYDPEDIDPPIVVRRSMPRRLLGLALMDAHVIVVRHARPSQLTLLHELTHCIGHHDHGLSFQKRLIELVARHVSPAHGDVFRAALAV
jgi:hypothetical protein